MPMAENELAESGHRHEHRDTKGGDEGESREHQRNVELEAGIQNQIGEARIAAARAGNELGDDSTDQRQATGDAQAGQKKWQGTRNAQANKGAETPRLLHPEITQQARIDAAQADDRVRYHGKDDYDRRANHQRKARTLDQDDDERRDRHDRGHLQQDDIGEERDLSKAALNEQEGTERADHDREGERL